LVPIPLICSGAVMLAWPLSKSPVHVISSLFVTFPLLWHKIVSLGTPTGTILTFLFGLRQLYSLPLPPPSSCRTFPFFLISPRVSPPPSPKYEALDANLPLFRYIAFFPFAVSPPPLFWGGVFHLFSASNDISFTVGLLRTTWLLLEPPLRLFSQLSFPHVSIRAACFPSLSNHVSCLVNLPSPPIPPFLLIPVVSAMDLFVNSVCRLLDSP